VKKILTTEILQIYSSVQSEGDILCGKPFLYWTVGVGLPDFPSANIFPYFARNAAVKAISFPRVKKVIKGRNCVRGSWLAKCAAKQRPMMGPGFLKRLYQK
jgi:hypothetical protein